MEFTGERYVPATGGIEDLYLEHVSRYIYASGLARGRRVLDVGCGCGYGSHRLAVTGATSVLGVDASAEAVDFAAAHYRHPGLRFQVADAGTMQVGDGYGLVTCFEVIEHVDDAPAALSRMAAATSVDGVLLVSTPNKDVYVAGGKDGANPFHRREYTREDFRDLLAERFPHVALLGQYWTEGIVVLPTCGSAGRFPAELVEDDGSGSGALALGDAPLYFVAACSKSSEGLKAAAALGPLATVAATARYKALKRHLRELEAEFDKRGRWARSLDEEIGRRDRTILSLRAEIQSLRAQDGVPRAAVDAPEKTIKEKV